MPIGPRSERVSNFGPVGASVFEKHHDVLTGWVGSGCGVCCHIWRQNSKLCIAHCGCVKVYVVLVSHVFCLQFSI